MTQPAEKRAEPTPGPLQLMPATHIAALSIGPVNGGPDIAMMLHPDTYDCDAWAKLFVAAPDTAAERDRFKAANVELLDLLEDLVDEDDCHYDHHGYCQAHGWMATDPICPHKRARDILAKAKESGS